MLKIKLHPRFCTTFLKLQRSRAVLIAEGTCSEVNPRVDLPLALVVLALPRVCLLPSVCFVYGLLTYVGLLIFFIVEYEETSTLCIPLIECYEILLFESRTLQTAMA